MVAVRPLATWRNTEAWKYKHPGAVEPSQAGLRVTSVVFRIFPLFALGAGFATLVVDSPEEREARRDSERADCEELAQRFGDAAVFDADGQLEQRGPVEELAREVGLRAEFTSLRLTTRSVDLVSVYDEDGELLLSVNSVLGATC